VDAEKSANLIHSENPFGLTEATWLPLIRVARSPARKNPAHE